MIKEKLKKLTNNIELMLLIGILITSTLCIGHVKLYTEVQIAIFIIMLIYSFIRCIRKNPIKLIESKQDILIIILEIATAIPIIANTYISYYETVTTILEYFTILWIYILAKETKKKNDRNVQYVKNVFLGISIILIFVGIENLTTNKIMDLISSEDIINGEGRLVSIFGNPNTLASFITFSLAISINEMINSKNNMQKTIYATFNTIFLLAIMLTYSKFIFVIIPLIILTYIIIAKGKKEKIYIICNTFLSLLLSILYLIYFQKFLIQEYYIAMAVFNILWIEMAYGLNFIFLKISKKIGSMSLKKIALICGTVTLLSTLWISLELKNTDKLVIFDKNINTTYYSKIIGNINSNEKYTIEFDIDAESENEDIEDMFIIKVLQRDSKSLDEIESEEILFNNFSGEKKIEIYTNSNTEEIKIEFKTKYKKIPKSLVINKMKVNDREIPLEYKHLPIKLVEKISNINIKYKTVEERLQFIKDGLKLISKNFLTGIGGGNWQYKYKEVQKYGYITNDVHSYYIQVWIEFGILGLIAILGITVCLVKNKKDVGIKIGILAILIHSAMDTDMYFMFMKIILFISLGILADFSNQKCKKADYFINAILIIVSVISIIVLVKPEIYDKELIMDKLKKQQSSFSSNTEEYKNISYNIFEESNKIIKYERYQTIQNKYELKRVENYIKSGKEELEKIIEEYYERMYQYKNKWKYDCDEILEKSNNITVIIQMLEKQENYKLYDWIEKLAKINIDEYEETKEQLEIAFRDKNKEMDKQIEYKNLNYNYNYANKIYNKYCVGVPIINNTEIDIKEYVKNDDILLENKNDIVIYYTHTTESYNSDEYEETEFRKTLNSEYNVLAVGEVLEENLIKNNINVINIKEYNDLDGIENAYSNSLKRINNDEKLKNIPIMFDLHRDSYEGNEKNKNYIEINSEKVANLRFVIGIGHDGWEDNLKWAIRLQKKAEELYPGLFKPIYIYKGKYNQEASKYATLIEVGQDTNTLEEAKRSMIYFSDVIAKVIEEN